MELQQLRQIFMRLSKEVRNYPERIGKPVRTKHLLQDMALIIHLLDNEKMSPTIQKFKLDLLPQRLTKIMGLTSPSEPKAK